MRPYLDEMFSALLASMLRARGVDDVSALELGRQEVADEIHLRLAAENGRSVITKDLRDYIALTSVFQQEGKPHAGVVLVPASRRSDEYSAIVGGLVRLHEQYPEGLPVID